MLPLPHPSEAKYDARGIANYFLDKAAAEGVPLTHLHLQKILYNAHGYFLAYYNRGLFWQDVQAWKYGPVVPAVYREFASYGRSPIDGRALVAEPTGFKFHPVRHDFDASDIAFLDSIWEGHKRVDPLRLSAISHEPGGPWEQVAKGKDLGAHKGVPIPPTIIRDYFRKQLTKRAAE